ncbi:MAG TPA: Mur ligase domain-containing protein [Thermoanaerobaculia bacterium]|nr:Mur ligase domain-containing protein [Thermoanaerobaculia bacterium]
MTSAPPRTFYLIAVGGTAMTPLAGLLLARGHRVLGSDLPLYPPMSDRLAALGIEVRPGFDARNLPEGVDVVVVGNLAGKDNPELVAALERGLPVVSMPETLGREILAGRHPVVVAGTHGKTTTTAITAWLLETAGLSPGYLVGGEPRNFPSPSSLGTGAPFVIEGDEYSTSYADKGPKFLHYGARTFVLTSVEFDHADLYQDLSAVKEAFRKGIALVPEGDSIVAYAGDPNVQELAKAARANVVYYGFPRERHGGLTLDYAATDVTPGAFGSRFTILERGALLANVETPLCGLHNVANALAAAAVARSFGASPRAITEGLATFRGVKRRMEERGEAGGVTVVDDFAHHPTAVETTLRGARDLYAGRRLWAVFEPRSHTASRADFAEEYYRALAVADGVGLARPFHAARLSREGGPGALDVEAIATRLTAAGVEAFAAADADALISALVPRLKPRDVVLGMSSGSFGGFHAKLLDALSTPPRP